ncbi:hypothetical protein M422DRAFT_260855 [Sphaerobolus stellatus SS14]|uniref:Uncharacterized protein n=1 Tax=Sphaerobolus stellatus (strain SS14) TaxID=990650 RepID=A0A0C9UJT7_SPHS4|nr:hypothetical protein M422DRAFT_273537 [Sphaerobolus stellatus SS14]KIJ36763.1 hypothetical protein M422DRAFT_260855 [Sphaerobolus stellatus SS14]
MSAPSDDLIQEGIRSRIIDTILGHTMTLAIRKATYMASRYTLNNEKYSATERYVRVFPEMKGFRLEWTVPMFLARIRYMASVKTEFVAQGLIWTIAITTLKSGKWSTFIYNVNHCSWKVAKKVVSIGGLQGALVFANALPAEKNRSVLEERINYKVIESLEITENVKPLYYRWKDNPRKLVRNTFTGGGAFP